MSVRRFVRRSRVEAGASELFAWHERPGAFERLTPPWEPVHVVHRTGSIRDGDRTVLAMRAGPFRVRWVAEHRDFQEGRRFRDVQIRGPFRRWEHTHEVTPDGPQASFLEDRIEYELALSPLSDWVAGPIVRRKLDRMFTYRHEVTQGDLSVHGRMGRRRPMNVLVTGSSGLIGSSLCPFLTTGGHQVRRLARGSTEIPSGIDAVVHLAGESISGRWSRGKKARILESRREGTRRLCEAIGRLDPPPAVLVCASAVGFYGNRGDEILTEDSPRGEGFLPDVCSAWESACDPARERGIRVVHLRTGIVLSGAGGALAKMLPPFRLGLGGPLGTGSQFMSWIAMDDLVGIILFALVNDSLAGPVNAVAPRAATNAEFTRTVGRVLGRPAFLPIPSFALRLAFGEGVDEMLLAGQRVVPERLRSAGFEWRYPDLDQALRHVLGLRQST